MSTPELQLRAELSALRQRLYELEKRIDHGCAIESLPRGPFPVLVCRLGNAPVAFPLEQVLEVVPVVESTGIPEAPAWILGFIDLRGEMVVVIDVLSRIERRCRDVLLSDQIVVCKTADRRVALVVQRVDGVQTINAGDLQTDADDLPHAPYLFGVFRQHDVQVQLFGIARLVHASDLPDGSATPEGDADDQHAHGSDTGGMP